MNETDVQVRAADVLRALLEQIPGIQIKDFGIQEGEIDILAHIDVAGRRHILLCEVKANGQPRYVRMALIQLQSAMAHYGRKATPILIAPYLSPEAQALCTKQQVGFLDLQGNARVVFDGVFIERLVPGKPSTVRREIKSLFRPKSAQVLKQLLHYPGHAWRVSELAKVSGVSQGHVSNVRSALLDREWASVAEEGLVLSEPDALLDSWQGVYEPPAGERLRFYTTLHGNAFVEAARQALGIQDGKAVFASFSAAQWLAPYGRIGTHYFYADSAGQERLRETLKLSSVAQGENIVVTLADDDGVFTDAAENAPGVFCTSPVQTYLDLSAAGERGKEAADHLRKTLLAWPRT